VANKRPVQGLELHNFPAQAGVELLGAHLAQAAVVRRHVQPASRAVRRKQSVHGVALRAQPRKTELIGHFQRQLVAQLQGLVVLLKGKNSLTRNGPFVAHQHYHRAVGGQGLHVDLAVGGGQGQFSPGILHGGVGRGSGLRFLLRARHGRAGQQAESKQKRKVADFHALIPLKATDSNCPNEWWLLESYIETTRFVRRKAFYLQLAQR
jgi:hypothetical protein